jgi:hypothetical protein
MVKLPDLDRQAAWGELMSKWSSEHKACPLSKVQLRDFLNAVDDWIDANAASYNQALPLAARNNLTPSQKAEGLLFMVERRFRKEV